jgi:hypothetical protein
VDSGSRIIRECEITTEDGLVGLVVLDGETISAKAAKGYEVLMQSILEDSVYVDKKIYRDKRRCGMVRGLAAPVSWQPNLGVDSPGRLNSRRY